MKKKILFVTLGLILIAVISAFILNRLIWAVDSVILSAVLVVIYFLRKQLNLTDFLFSLICILVLMHCFAVFGLFKMTFFGLEYDTYVHTYSSIVIAMVAFNYALKFRISKLEAVFIALFITLGVELFNELVEYAGYRFFGRGEGLFLLGPGDIGATNAFENLMTDFFSDFYGNIAGIVLSVLYHFRCNNKTKN
ncbi:MAG: hypothetical protein ACOC5R_01540 [Elusimicrobiota bacterium]